MALALRQDLWMAADNLSGTRATTIATLLRDQVAVNVAASDLARRTQQTISLQHQMI